MASTQLQRTAVTSTENYKYTFSAWVKRTGVLGSSSLNEVLFSNWSDNNNSAYIRFEDQNDNLHVFDKYGSTIDLNYQTNMKFRDPNAWYHIVVNVDGSRSANQRCKIYVNGSEVSCSNTTDTGGTLAMKTVTTTNAMRLGAIRTSSGAEYYFSGLMSHVHYIDGTGYDASYFGETDSTTGEWKIKTNVTGVTYGNNGFFVLKDGNSVTDQSPNTNNFTVTAGTLTKSEDNPSNVFATLNPLSSLSGQNTFSYGNNRCVTNSGTHPASLSTLGLSSGKYYYEAKITTGSNTSRKYCVVGITDNPQADTMSEIGEDNYSAIIYMDTGQKRINGSLTSYGVGFDFGDIIGVFIDLDNSKLYFSKNGVVMNSGTGIDITPVANTNSGFYFAGVGDWDNSASYTWDLNFGNGCFGNTQLTGTTYNGSDSNGIFKYNPNNITLDGSSKSFKSISTKGLNQ